MFTTTGWSLLGAAAGSRRFGAFLGLQVELGLRWRRSLEGLRNGFDLLFWLSFVRGWGSRLFGRASPSLDIC